GRLAGESGSGTASGWLPLVVLPQGNTWSMPYTQANLLIPFLAGDPYSNSVAATVSIVSETHLGAAPNLTVNLDLPTNYLVIQNHSASLHLAAQLQIVLTARNNNGATQSIITLNVVDHTPALSA